MGSFQNGRGESEKSFFPTLWGSGGKPLIISIRNYKEIKKRRNGRILYSEREKSIRHDAVNPCIWDRLGNYL